MKNPEKIANAALVLLRIAVGWHFLYEGVWKLMQNGKWSCVSMLAGSTGPLAGPFQALADSPTLVAVSDWAVMLGLAAIGLSLLSGVLSRIAAPFGMLMMLMFYSSMPPEPFARAISAADGHFFLIERNLIELVALAVIAVFPSQVPIAFRNGAWRRLLLALMPGAAAFLIFAGCFAREVVNGEFNKPEAVTSATVKVHEFTQLSALTNKLDATVSIAGVKVSPLVLGGDLIAGHAHARDLIWADEFMRRYHTGGALERTIRYATYAGVNACFVEPQFISPIIKAAKDVNSSIHCFANCATAEDAKAAAAAGAKAVYLRPEEADRLARNGDGSGMLSAFAALAASGLPVGFGAEDVETVEKAVKIGIKPAFWVVAFHGLDYPAASLGHGHNNLWCRDPARTARVMNSLKEPWVSIRALAGGAITPECAFGHARKHGVEAVAIDLLEFRIIETVNKISAILAKEVK